jgi:hypothetical protein
MLLLNLLNKNIKEGSKERYAVLLFLGYVVKDFFDQAILPNIPLYKTVSTLKSQYLTKMSDINIYFW